MKSKCPSTARSLCARGIARLSFVGRQLTLSTDVGFRRFDVARVSQTTMNIAAITGPSTMPFMPKTSSPPSVEISTNLRIGADQDRTHEIVHQADDEGAVRDQDKSLPNGARQQEIDRDGTQTKAAPTAGR